MSLQVEVGGVLLVEFELVEDLVQLQLLLVLKVLVVVAQCQLSCTDVSHCLVQIA